MNITILVSKLTGGGAERVASLWATGFVQRGHNVSIIVDAKSNRDITYFMPDVVDVYSLGSDIYPYVFRKILNKIRYYIRPKKLRMRDILLKLKPDVIIGVLRPLRN